MSTNEYAAILERLQAMLEANQQAIEQANQLIAMVNGDDD